MKGIRIFANGIELQYEVDTLTVNRENNAFINDFKVSHSSFPFLIIENQAAKQALGPREITSVNKRKVVDVVVIEGGQTFTGQLSTLNYLNGFRKCDLKYGSSALVALDKKLSGLLPVISIIGDSTPEPFTAEAPATVPGYLSFPEYAELNTGKIFPEVNFTFPMMAWKDKFGENLEEGEDWAIYNGYYNFYTASGQYHGNTFAISSEGAIVVNNKNVPSPQLFALGILKLAFASIGWTIAGGFVDSAFARRILMLSDKDNLCKVKVGPEPIYFDFEDFTYAGLLVYYRYRYYFTPAAAGEYYVNFYGLETLRNAGVEEDKPSTTLFINQAGTSTNLYRNFNDPENLSFSGQYTFTVTDEQAGQEMRIEWGSYGPTGNIPPVQLLLAWGPVGKDLYMMHPTIELGRYAPDWSLAEFINELKLEFCLDVQFDDLAQVATFNFARDILTSPDKFVCSKKLLAEDYAPPANFGIVMKGAAAEDDFILVNNDGITLNYAPESDYIETIETKFKVVPHNGQTADLAAAANKDGQGLMIYDPQEPDAPGAFVLPFINTDFNGYTLSITGARGTYATYWKSVLQMKLNGSTLTMQGAFTDIEVRQLQRLQKLHINNQEYIILGAESKPTRQDNIMVKFSLQSVNF